MGVNRDKPDRWKADTAKSVKMYNEWYLDFASRSFQEAKRESEEKVESAFRASGYFRKMNALVLKENPGILTVLRASTAPPIARDRLGGLAGTELNILDKMEDRENSHLPPRMDGEAVENALAKMVRVVDRMLDKDIFVWIDENRMPMEFEIRRATEIVADRLSVTTSGTAIRNAQERRQLKVIETYLLGKGYVKTDSHARFDTMKKGTFLFRSNVPVRQTSEKMTNMPVDVLIMPKQWPDGAMPILMEAKSAGDFANVNKRRKEEATKIRQLKATYGDNVVFVLFLCGYFDAGYLGYEAAEGIDWIWEHRLSDMEELGI